MNNQLKKLKKIILTILNIKVTMKMKIITAINNKIIYKMRMFKDFQDLENIFNLK